MSPASQRFFKTGERIAGRYLLLECIGDGGHAAIWSALDERQGRPVALKFLKPECCDIDEAWAVLRQESQLARRGSSRCAGGRATATKSCLPPMERAVGMTSSPAWRLPAFGAETDPGGAGARSRPFPRVIHRYQGGQRCWMRMAKCARGLWQRRGHRFEARARGGVAVLGQSTTSARRGGRARRRYLRTRRAGL
jgi:hypothetical protein